MSDSITYEVKVWANGTQRWYLDGKRHRVDGPAVTWSDGTQFWYLNGKCHRVDGPAILYADKTQSWYLDDKQVTEAEHARRTQKPVDDCAGKVVEIDGKKYKLALV